MDYKAKTDQIVDSTSFDEFQDFCLRKWETHDRRDSTEFCIDDLWTDMMHSSEEALSSVA